MELQVGRCRREIRQAGGGADIVLDVHGRAPGFEEKLSRAADAKTVIRRFGAVGGFDGVCVDYILVVFSVAANNITVSNGRMIFIIN